ncbi:hypothetical protein ABW20_dc0110707 [Dactylellina cionopaga]|nr:hypothetical protein ABW20_dc0110707 [Dactylellina cionopaga]
MSKWDWKSALGTSESSTAEWLKWAANQRKDAVQRQPTKFHRWLNLEKSERIKEIFTMNVDGLESKYGLIPGVNIRQLHGSFTEVICRVTRSHRREMTENDERFLDTGSFPPCLDCEILNSGNNLRTGMRERRNQGMRPHILLYNDQDLNGMPDIYTALTETQRKYKGRDKVDLLLIVGTSLPPEVYHLKTTISRLKKCAKFTVYVDPAPKRTRDFDQILEMTADDLADLLGYPDLVDSNEVVIYHVEADGL